MCTVEEINLQRLLKVNERLELPLDVETEEKTLIV